MATQLHGHQQRHRRGTTLRMSGRVITGAPFRIGKVPQEPNSRDSITYAPRRRPYIWSSRQSHSAHHTEHVTVHYPWHPLHGQTVLAQRSVRHGRDVWLCEHDQQTIASIRLGPFRGGVVVDGNPIIRPGQRTATGAEHGIDQPAPRCTACVLGPPCDRTSTQFAAVDPFSPGSAAVRTPLGLFPDSVSTLQSKTANPCDMNCLPVRTRTEGAYIRGSSEW